jgi:putative Mn2+ efflux pump MntP/predicted MPP superfamily phosphohydrolase
MNILNQVVTPVLIFLVVLAIIYVLEAGLLVRYVWRKLRRKAPMPLRRYHLLIHTLALLGLLCMVYGKFIEPYWPQVNTIRLETPKLQHTALRIVQISDLHCDVKPRLENRLPKIINSLKPDIIVFTGDALNTHHAIGLFQKTLAAMEAPLGKYAVRGNWDYQSGTKFFDNTGFTELPLKAVRLEKDGEAFMLCGIAYHNGRISQRALNQLDPNTWNCLLYHSSTLLSYLEDEPVDLYLCGHTHGGQVALPFYGSLTTIARNTGGFEAGLYTLGSMAVYVNRGIGMGGLGPRVRFCARPEITVFEIVPASGGTAAPVPCELTLPELLTIIGVGVGLAMDAFAVSVVCGAVFCRLRILHAVRMAVFFGAFQSLMPLLGFMAGKSFESFIGIYDHWLAFTLLVIIGGKMIYEAFKIEEVEKKPADPSGLLALLVLSIATSIDALAVGFTLSLITHSIAFAVSLIGLITFVLSYAGYVIGKRFGHFFENKIEILGGLILIAIGIKILIQHLCFC